MTENEASYFQPHQVADRSVKAGRTSREPSKLSSDISQGSGDTSMESNSSSCKGATIKKSKQKRLSMKVWSSSKVKISMFYFLSPSEDREGGQG